jgi:hypothetical protein
VNEDLGKKLSTQNTKEIREVDRLDTVDNICNEYLKLISHYMTWHGMGVDLLGERKKVPKE